jgi:molybdenum cofactor synthesis domain-containing protein
MAAASVTAALLVIGDEILSGRTKDKNIGYIAEYLTGIGIDLREVRVVPDVEDEIVAAVNALRARYAYLFTTGGIGPTHDDITADSVARAFGVHIDVDPRAVAMLRERYKPEDLNEARLRMARIPHGADLVDNPISRAPGFRIGNVIVMAGVPTIMQAMLDNVAPTLETGARMLVETVDAGNVPEGLYAAGLGEIAAHHAGVSIGSYPSFTVAGFANQIVVRGKDRAAVDAAAGAVRALIARLVAERTPA